MAVVTTGTPAARYSRSFSGSNGSCPFVQDIRDEPDVESLHICREFAVGSSPEDVNVGKVQLTHIDAHGSDQEHGTVRVYLRQTSDEGEIAAGADAASETDDRAGQPPYLLWLDRGPREMLVVDALRQVVNLA